MMSDKEQTFKKALVKSAKELREENKSLERQIADWERRSESCESKLGQLEANEELMMAQVRIAELETATALYQSDAERIWALIPELRNTDAHYELHEAVQHNIAELSAKNADLVVACGDYQVSLNEQHRNQEDLIGQRCELEHELTEAKRKLAEQQSLYRKLALLFNPASREEFMTENGFEELTTLLAKAKEEGRKEAVEDALTIQPNYKNRIKTNGKNKNF